MIYNYMSTKAKANNRTRHMPNRGFSNNNLGNAIKHLRKTHVKPPFPPPIRKGVNATFMYPLDNHNLIPHNYVKHSEFRRALEDEQMANNRTRHMPNRGFHNNNLGNAIKHLRKTHVKPPFPPPRRNGVHARFMYPNNNSNLMPHNYVKHSEFRRALEDEQLRNREYKKKIGKQAGGATRRKRGSTRGRR